MDTSALLSGYDLKKLTIGALGGHSALDVLHGAKKFGFRTLAVAQQGRDQTYKKYFRTRPYDIPHTTYDSKGCVDDVLEVQSFADILHDDAQKTLRDSNTLFVHSRYFWVYMKDFAKVETAFHVPIFGSRTLLKLEERDHPFNQYHVLQQAGIRSPKLFLSPYDIDRPVLVKASEAKRRYERGFFVVSSQQEYEEHGTALEKSGAISSNWREAPIEEFIVGAAVNFNYFYSPLTGELELLGTDMRRQTNLDGFLRMTADEQTKASKHVPLRMVETGHVAVTVKESLLEKAFEMGEKFVKATQSLPKEVDPSGKGIIGPFALQGSVVAEDGKEDIVIFDVSFRIPGSPGIRATPYSGYLYGEPISMGERIGMELRKSLDESALEKILT